MNLQESIRKVLREETKLPSFIRRRYSEEDIDELISNVKFSIPKYDDDKNIDDVIYDEVREFMMDKSDFGYHGTLRNDLTGNEYYLQLYKFEEPLRDYVKSVILNTNLQESIRKVLREELNEIRVPRKDRDQIYKDDNIIVVVPHTHLALKKYANKCQWCINSDREDWEDYHKGKHVIIIQRNPQKLKMGITGHPTASEIFTIAKWDNNMSSVEDVEDMLGYIFRSERSMQNYYLDLTKDISNFALNTVYYSPEEGGVFDMEDNYLPNFNYEINDVPNVTPEVIDLIKKHILE